MNLTDKNFVNGSDVELDIAYLASSTGPHNDDILQVGEEFSFICAAPNTENEYINTVGVSGVGVISGNPASDDDTSEVKINDPEFDLALRKTLSATTPGPFNPGDRVMFNITVFNQGNVDATNVVVTDYIPTELTVRNTNVWTVS